MSYWRLEEPEGTILIPAPELLAAALMPSSRFAAWMLDPARRKAPLVLRGSSSASDGKTIQLTATRRLDAAEAITSAALVVFEEAWHCFSTLAYTRGSAREGDNGGSWIRPFWPLPARTVIAGLMQHRTLRRGGRNVNVRVVASVDNLIWPFSEMDAVISYPGARGTEGIPITRRRVATRGVFLHPGEDASADEATLVEPSIRAIDPGNLLVRYERRPTRGTSTAEWRRVPAGPRDGTTAEPGPEGELPHVELRGNADQPQIEPSDRLKLTIAALECLALDGAIGPVARGGPVRNVHFATIPRLDGGGLWAIVGGHLRQMLAVVVTVGSAKFLFVDCEVNDGESLALSLLQLGLAWPEDNSWLAPLAKRMARTKGLLRHGGSLPGHPLGAVDRIRHPSRSVEKPEVALARAMKKRIVALLPVGPK